jgi:hypothetical protein
MLVLERLLALARWHDVILYFMLSFLFPAVIVGRNTSSWDEINRRGMKSIIVG